MSGLRAVPLETGAPLTFDEAQSEFQVHYKAARLAYIDVLGFIGNYRMQELLRSSSSKPVTLPGLRNARDEAQKVATQILAVVTELTAALDAGERYKRSIAPEVDHVIACPHCMAPGTQRSTMPTLAGEPVSICTACQRIALAREWVTP